MWSAAVSALIVPVCKIVAKSGVAATSQVTSTPLPGSAAGSIRDQITAPSGRGSPAAIPWGNAGSMGVAVAPSAANGKNTGPTAAAAPVAPSMARKVRRFRLMPRVVEVIGRAPPGRPAGSLALEGCRTPTLR